MKDGKLNLIKIEKEGVRNWCTHKNIMKFLLGKKCVFYFYSNYIYLLTIEYIDYIHNIHIF